jgi:2-polyprenyl-3-methyl-5-hydroxy-6-metoxy-1,4-benzoquinol methylase
MSATANVSGGAPYRVDTEAEQRFLVEAKACGLNPNSRWVKSYVEWEWTHTRHIWDSPLFDLRGKKVLEFGCNIGATSIILTMLGAEVTGVEVDADCVKLANLNARIYGLPRPPQFLHVPDTRKMPFAAASFDFVTCNSVLEIVPAPLLADIQKEIDRVLKPGGQIVVTGTSSRLYPLEVHSRKLFVNYLPRTVDRMIGRPIQRGVWPWQMRHGFGRHYSDVLADKGASVYLEAKRKMGLSGVKMGMLTAAAGVMKLFGVSVGEVMPSMFLVLRKNATR